MTQKIAFIGPGSMGNGMAASVLRAGHLAYGFDVNPAQTACFQAEGGQPGRLSDLAPSLDAALVVVLNAAQTETVLFGPDGIVQHLAQGAVVIACATVPPACAHDFAARCDAYGVHYLDAPISGGSAKAANGQLSIMASGKPAAFAAANPML